jgi:DNA-binding NarL/FixJ family response regulator
MTKKTRILIVDDHVLMQEGLRSLFMPHLDFEVVGGAGTIREAFKQAIELEPDLVLMDIGLPDGDGLEATRMILAQRPETKVVMLTMHDSDELLFGALRSGAVGYLMKNTPALKLVQSLRVLEQDEAPLSRKMTKRLIKEYVRVERLQQSDNSPRLDALTAREKEVIEELASGASNQEIAQHMFISKNTVKCHVHSILKKLELKNRTEAAKFARRQSFNDLPDAEHVNSPRKKEQLD